MMEHQKELLNGWPKSPDKLKDELQFDFKIRGDINYENGVLYYNNMVIIPTSLKET